MCVWQYGHFQRINILKSYKTGFNTQTLFNVYYPFTYQNYYYYYIYYIVLYCIAKMDQGSNVKSKMKKVTKDFYVDKTNELGRGNYGIVYKGYHLSANRIVAVKFIDRRMLKMIPNYEREINVMKDLAKINHPNIMGYYGCQENDDGLYSFIEYCDGGTLKDLLKTKISQLKVLTLLKQLLDAMTYINQQNKIHRDLKPDNLLLDQNGDLKIADFGLARDVDENMTKGYCTPLYAAPQVLLNGKYDQKCDVWSSGLILYEMLVGHQLFDFIRKRSDLLKQVAKFANPQHKVEIPKQLHSRWKDLIAKMLTHSAADRPKFKELKEYFNSIEPEMRKDLIAKYDEQSLGNQNEQNALRITKSVSPYQPNLATNGVIDMVQKLKQEKSFTHLNNLRKWLNFSRQKAEVLLKLIKQFSNTDYDCLKNVNKYILMFLSVSCYISKMMSGLAQLSGKKVATSQSSIIQQYIISKHMKQYKEMIKQAQTKLQATIIKYRNVSEKQIVIKLLNTYMKKEEDQKIITGYASVVNLLKEAKEGKYEKQDVYMSMFKKVANTPGVHFPINLTKQMKYEDMKVYTYIRIIANIDDVFLNINFKNDDYLRSKKQQIENATKDELLQIVQKYNNNK